MKFLKKYIDGQKKKKRETIGRIFGGLGAISENFFRDFSSRYPSACEFGYKEGKIEPPPNRGATIGDYLPNYDPYFKAHALKIPINRNSLFVYCRYISDKNEFPGEILIIKIIKRYGEDIGKWIAYKESCRYERGSIGMHVIKDPDERFPVPQLVETEEVNNKKIFTYVDYSPDISNRELGVLERFADRIFAEWKSYSPDFDLGELNRLVKGETEA